MSATALKIIDLSLPKLAPSLEPLLYRGDCIEVMASLPPESVDLVLTDPPYGTTTCAWDSIIPLKEMWQQLLTLKKQQCAIVLMASQPYTSVLISSKISLFKYCWVWDKVNRPTGHLNSKHMPLRETEDITVFYGERPTYNPQMEQGTPYRITGDNKYCSTKGKTSANYGEHLNIRSMCVDGMRYPRNILPIKADERGTEGRIHPTQKPVALMEYLIKTYTNPGQVVLDFTMGSGTTGVACRNLGRKFVGIEKDEDYYNLAVQRITRL